MQDILVSVIIPVYNVEAYLRECLESVCNQTLKEIEIICINDGSTDGSGAILDEYAQRDSRIVVIHSSNEGLSAARNKGIIRARAEYITFLDSDDYFAPTLCEELYTAMYYNDVDIVICGIQVISEEGQEYRTDEHAYYIQDKSGKSVITVDIVGTTIVVAYAKLLKKSLIDAYSIYFLEGRLYEDNYFTKAYLSIAKTIYYIQKNLFYRRLRNNSITDMSLKGYNDTHIDALYQLEHLFYFWQRLGMLNDDYIVLFWCTYANTLSLIYKNLPYRYLHTLFNVSGTFIDTYYSTIPQGEEYISLRTILSHYMEYKDIKRKDIASYIRCAKQKISS